MLTQPHPGRVLRSTGLPQTEKRLNPVLNADIGVSRRALNSGTRRADIHPLLDLSGAILRVLALLNVKKGLPSCPYLTGEARIHVVFSILF